ncbi:hypothetical protein [Paenibacillus sp. SI8]|uniref:hypothetical protein n=1 Tax=unclassified Paenibacillus TaxID=185978 RepID=UPI0034664913
MYPESIWVFMDEYRIEKRIRGRKVEASTNGTDEGMNMGWKSDSGWNPISNSYAFNW